MRKQEKPAFGGCGSSLLMGRLQEGASKTGRIIESKLSRASEGWDAATFEIYRFEGGLTGEQSRSIRLFFVRESNGRIRL